MDCEGSKERSAFTFVWRIDNFSCLEDVEPGYILDGPLFKALTLDESEWYLRLFPKGRSPSDKCVKLGLILLNRKNFSNINCEWSYINHDESPLMTGTVKNRKIGWAELFNLSPGPTQEQVFKTQKAEFLPLDSLTLRCRIWKSEGSATTAEHVFVNTKVEVREDSFIWPIEGFSTLELNQKITNPVGLNYFPLVSSATLKFSLTGPSLRNSDVDFEITMGNVTKTLHMNCNISVLDDGGNEMKDTKKEYAFRISNNSQTWIIPKFLSRQECLKKRKEYLSRGALTVLFKSRCIKGYSGLQRTSRGQVDMKPEAPMKNSSIVENEPIQNSGHTEPFNSSQNSSNSIVVLRQDLLSMYKDHSMSDFELRSGDVSFKVHRNVLSARSPVFKTMFSADMKEANSGSIEVPDIDCHTLNRMLTFLYAGVAEDLTCESALTLYYAADKYQVSTLKQECSSVLRSNIHVSNVCDILALADRHQDAELTSSVHDFVLENFDDILLSMEWGKFLETDAYLAGITVRQVYKKKLQGLRSQ